MTRSFFRPNESVIERFNRRLGYRTGRPLHGYTYRSGTPHDQAALARRIARGSVTVKPSITRNYNRNLPSMGGVSSAQPTAEQHALSAVYNNLVKEFQQNSAEQEAINRANSERERDSDRAWYQDIWNAVGGYDLGDSGPVGSNSGFRGSWLGRALDLLSRPIYGVSEGLQSLAEQQDHTGWNPGDLVHSLGNFFSGVGRGLTGENKTGFGNVVQSLAENPTSSIGQALHKLEVEHPFLAHGGSNGPGPNILPGVFDVLGFAGELGLDPLNWVIPAAPRVMRETGELATEDVLRETFLRQAREATQDFITNSPLATNRPAYAANPQALIDRVANSADEAFTDALVTVAGGGRPSTTLLNNRMWPTLVANRATNELREGLTEFFTARVEDLWTRGRQGTFTEATVNAMRQHSKDFDEFWTALEHEMTNRGVLSATSTTQDLLDAIHNGSVTRRTFDGVLDDVMEKYSSELDATFGDMLRNAENPTYRTLGVRVGSKEIPFKISGKAYKWLGTKFNKVFPNHANEFERVFFESQFPGIFGVKTGRARALGFNAVESFRDDLRRIAADFTAEQGAEIQRLLEQGVRNVADPKIQNALDEIRRMYDDIYAEEVKFGARPYTDARKDDYTYIFNKGGDKTKRTLFKEERSRAWKDHGHPGNWNIQTAKAMGLKPVENAFENLFLRYVKSRRDMTRALFLQDLVSNYSVYRGRPIRRLSARAIRERGLHEIPLERLQESFRQMVTNKGGAFYMPNEIWKVSERFRELTSWSTADWNKLGRAYAKVIQTLKAGLTIPYPGFHVRNMIGDVFMGLLDDINPSAYTEMMQKWTLKKAGRKSIFKIIPGRLEMDWDAMYADYMSHADTGFFNIEFGTYQSLTAGSIPNRLGRRIRNQATDIADTREFIPRFVHYTEAYRQEANALWKRGIRDLDEIQRRAADAAMWRVNAYKFDYSALLPWEKKLKTLAFPFYTYMRKAAPLLMQQLFMNPKWFGRVGRLMEYNDGSAADDFNALNIPQWIKDSGFAMLTDEEEPLAITADILPFGTLDVLQSLGPWGSPEETMRQLLGNLNPVLQAPVELATGRTLFDDRPIQGSSFDYLIQHLPMLRDIQEELVDIPGVPGGGTQTVFDQLSNDPIQALHNRLSGLGIPVRRITARQQEQQQQENRDQLIDDPLRQFNYSQDRYSISVTDDFQYRIIDKVTGQVIATAATPQAAIQYALSLPGSDYQQPYVSPYHNPTMQDVMTRLGL